MDVSATHPSHDVSSRQCALSVIVPTFRSGATILRCLESIGRQTFADYEILIQDGNSPDNTVDLVRAFASERPNITIRCVQEPDSGVYDAMNKAMQRAHGEWLLFMGSDDALHGPDVFERVLLDPKTQTADLVYGNVELVGDTPWARNGTIYSGEFSLDKFLTTNICHQAMFYRSSLARSVGPYNTNYPVCADYDFNMRCWAKGKLVYLDMVVAYFYSGGISSQSDKAFFCDFHTNVRRYGLLKQKPVLERMAYVWENQVSKRSYWSGKLRKLWSKPA